MNLINFFKSNRRLPNTKDLLNQMKSSASKGVSEGRPSTSSAATLVAEPEEMYLKGSVEGMVIPELAKDAAAIAIALDKACPLPLLDEKESKPLEGEVSKTVKVFQTAGKADVQLVQWTPKHGFPFKAVKKTYSLHAQDSASNDEESVRQATIARMIREATVWLSLDHPHILKIEGYGLSSQGEDPFILMPYMEKRDLSRYLRDNPNTTNSFRLKMLIQIADALAYIHGRPTHQIVHGDIKAANVLLDNVSGRALLTDFGSARVEGPLRTGLSSGSQVGTTGFEAPEACKHNPISPVPITASDVYSFGGLIVEVLSGIMPFGGCRRHKMEVVRLILEGGTTPRREHPKIPEKATIWDLADRCWKHDPDQRPKMKEILEVLEQEKAHLIKTKRDALRSSV